MIGKDAMKSKSYLKLENNTVMKKCSILEGKKAVKPIYNSEEMLFWEVSETLF